MNDTSYAVEKILSANDTGETGAHMAGILIPKEERILSFFPSLDTSVKNPRQVLDFTDEAGEMWSFPFIYYNNKFFGGTRNEYRLTGMTRFLRQYCLKAGDRLRFVRDGSRNLEVFVIRRDLPRRKEPIQLGGWRVIKI